VLQTIHAVNSAARLPETWAVNAFQLGESFRDEANESHGTPERPENYPFSNSGTLCEKHNFLTPGTNKLGRNICSPLNM